MKIGFIGAGNMGGAILRGYAPFANEDGNEILVYTPTVEKREAIARETGATATDGIEDIVRATDIIILGVKPNIFGQLMPQIAAAFAEASCANVCAHDFASDDINADSEDEGKLLISMAAGITIGYMEGYLGKSAKIIRIMPNTPAQVGASMIAMCRNANVNDGIFAVAKAIFDHIGAAEEVDEELIHCVIGVSGSSPAYTFMYIDALIAAVVVNGMEKDKARIFAAQAVKGAAEMVLQTETDVNQLCINVCSPGGTTIEAVHSLEKDNFKEIIVRAFKAAVDRSKEMSE